VSTPTIRRVDGQLVLLVDDNEVLAKLTRLAFESAGFRVRVAESAVDALRIAGTARPDVIVSDIVMDQVDGFSLCRMFRAEPTLSKIPLVLISSYFDETRDAPLARAAGATHLVHRTPDVADCVDTVVALLRGGVVPPPKARRTSSPSHRRASIPALARTGATRAKNDDRYEALFDQAADAMAILTPSGVIVSVNKTWEDLTGKNKSELVGLALKDIAKPWVPGDSGAAMRRNRFTSIVAVATAKGKPVYLEIAETRVSVGGAPTVLSIGREVTDLVERHLRSAKGGAGPS
jgi:PAS domain S-box-containing protein